MTIPDAGLGAVIAASIAAALSFFGLVISKEQKVSEFRQAWIDAVRQDIAMLMAAVHAIDTFERLENVEPIEHWTAARADFMIANEALLRLKLRLNPEEERPAEIFSLLDRMETLLNEPLTAGRSDELTEMEAALVGASAKMLKLEWRRVKEGEPIFVVAKWGASLIAGVAFLKWLY